MEMPILYSFPQICAIKASQQIPSRLAYLLVNYQQFWKQLLKIELSSFLFLNLRKLNKLWCDLLHSHSFFNVLEMFVFNSAAEALLDVN